MSDATTSAPRARRLAAPLAVATFAIGIGGLALELTIGKVEVGGLMVVTLPVLGFLLLSRRPENRISWVFAAFAAAVAIQSFSEAYVSVRPKFPVWGWVQWVQQLNFGIALPLLPLALLLFPDGRPASPRWRVAIWIDVAAMIAFTVSAALGGDGDAGWPLVGIAILAGGASLVVRFRRAAGTERQQLRWIAASGVCLIIGWLSLWVIGEGTFQWVGELAIQLAIGLFIVSVCIAILRYRLYDIDLVIRKTVVFGALAAFITGVYVGVVVALADLTTDSLVPSIVATAIVAVAFQPVRERVTRLANRLVFGDRAEPYEVLARFSDRVGAVYTDDDALDRTARVIAEGTGAQRAEVWIRLGDAIRRAATWPPQMSDGPQPDPDLSIEVNHQGEVLGEIRIHTAPGQALQPTESKLLEDLAAQAGTVLRNLRLAAELEARVGQLSRRAEELRASRSRIVQAHDAERRRLERNIHDGAQQHLVALAVKLRLAGSLTEREAAKAEFMLRETAEQTDVALRTLMDLATGIYPSALEESGIVAALEHQARTSSVPVRITPVELDRFPIDVEAAVYFVCLEAIQNASKYAQASRVEVRLAQDNGLLTFEVADDGLGFEVSAIEAGVGLQSMRDRLAGLGGNIRIDSSPGRGTVVSGRVPVPEEAKV